MKQFIVCLFAVWSFKANAQLALPYNQGFEVSYNTADNWRLYTQNGAYALSYTDSVKRTGKYSLLIDGKSAQRTLDDNDGGFTRIVIPHKLLAGKKRARIEAWVKTNSSATHAALWLNQYRRHSNTSDPLNVDITDSVNDHKEWQHLKVEINLGDSAFSTEFGALVNGSGKAWFDDFVLYLDDVKVKDLLKPAKQPTTKEIAWLNENTVPLSSVKETTNNADLKTISQWIGAAKLIGVGEPTHGTSETGLFRLRLFKYLAENKGFNVFMIEDQLPECGLVNDYVMGKTDSAGITDYLNKGGATQETVDMVNWIRQYNGSHQDKVQFAGMDMQSAKVALDNIKRFAALHDDSLSPHVDNLIRYSEGINKNWYDTAGIAAKWPFTQNAIANIKTYTDRKIASYYSLLPKDSVNWFVLNLNPLCD